MDSQKHPLLNDPCSKLLSFRVTPMLHNALNQNAQVAKKPLSDFVREILVQAIQPTKVPQRLPINTVIAEPSRAKKAFDAFNNPDVVHAIKSLASGIESGAVDTNARSILEYFISFLPAQ